MKLSTRARYGLRFMLELALNYGSSTYLKEIAEKEEISEKYLSQLTVPLKAAGLIDSVRGAYGGYILKRKPQDINIKEIVQVLEGDLSLVPCIGDPSLCTRVTICVTRDIWKNLTKKITETLASLTLEDLVRMYKGNEVRNLMYNI